MWAVGDVVGDSSPRRGMHSARALGGTALRSSTASGGDHLQARPPRPGSPFAECSRPFTLEAGVAATVEVRLVGVPRELRAKAEHKAEHAGAALAEEERQAEALLRGTLLHPNPNPNPEPNPEPDPNPNPSPNPSPSPSPNPNPSPNQASCCTSRA